MNEAYYATAAQVIPVLLLAVALELRFVDRSDRESVAESVWFAGFFLETILAEMLALIALLEERALSTFEDIVILLMIFYGVALIGLLPVVARMARSAVRSSHACG